MYVRHFQRTAMIIGAFLAASLFFAGGAALRLALGPISMGPFAGAIEDALNRSISGLVVRFDQAVLEWSHSDGNINLAILGAKVFDVNGRIIAQAPKADLDFDGAALLGGEIALKRFALLGIQVTAVRGVDGTLKLGFGPVQGETDILAIIRDTLKRSSGGSGSLETFSISDARLAFRDEPSGAFIVSPNLTFEIRNTVGRLSATLEAAVEVSGAPAVIAARVALRDNGTPESGTVNVQGLDFSALVANSETFSALRLYPLKADIQGDFAMGAGGELDAVAFTVESNGQVFPPGLGTFLQVDTLALAGRYDGASDRLTFDHISLSGPNAGAQGTADFRFLWRDQALVVASAALKLNNVNFTAPELFASPLRLANFGVEAIYDLPTKRLTVINLALAGSGAAARFNGSTTFADAMSPAIRLNGTLDPLTTRDLLKFWPVRIGNGARSWIADNISEGMMGPFTVAANIPAGAFGLEALPEEALNITFPIVDMSAIYMKGLTPLTDGNGNGQLTGDTFRAQMTGGSVGPLSVTSGDILIPNIHLSQTPGRFRAHIDGPVPDVLRLIDMEPLGYAKRFRINPEDTEGSAAVDLDFAIPMKRNLRVDEVKISVAGKVNGLALPLNEKRHLESGIASLTIDNERLTAEGAVRMSGVPLAFKWAEEFSPVGTDVTTKVDIQARLNDASRASLGWSEPRWLSGTIPVVAVLSGQRFVFHDAEIRADLTGATATLDAINAKKEAGEQATGSGNLRFLPGGAIAVSDLVVTGDEISARGGLSLGRDGNLVAASLSEVKVGPENDFSLDMEAPAGGAPIWHIRGRAVDATRWVVDPEPPPPGQQPQTPPKPARGTEPPVVVRATVDQALLRDNQRLRAVNFALALGPGLRVNDFSLDAEGPGAEGKVVGRFKEAAGAREITVQAEGGGDFIRAVSGFPSVRGGKIALRVNFRPPQTLGAGDYTGVIQMDDFTVVDQPFLARLFSIGTLDGPLRLLQGQGIEFSRLESAFVANGPVWSFQNGRASGPAMGLSFQGVVDRDKDTLNLNGSMAPVFGLNSMLGALPIVGNILTSKEGEGIFGLTYQVRGNLLEPNVAVNPLSMLTPGIFRRIFEFGGPPRLPAPEAAPTPDPPGAPPSSAN